MNLRHTALLTLVLAGSAALSGPVLADTREDVISASQRCGLIADDRSWLDCYYGAAQPMRSRIGLPPAPASQLRLVPGIGQGAPASPAYQQPAYQPAYPQQGAPAYGIGPNGGVPYTPRPVAAGPAAPAGPPPLPRARTGFLTAMFGDSKPIVSNLRMASYELPKGKPFTVTLSDGQVWEENRNDDANPPLWRGPASRYVVNITQGASSTYNMKVTDDSSIYKMHRVK